MAFCSKARTFLVFSRVALAAGLLASSWAIAAPEVLAAGLFTGLAGDWRGDGSIGWSSGETERIRCTATYEVGGDGNSLQQTLTCATDSTRLIVKSDIRYNPDAGAITGTWSEANYGITGRVTGRASSGTIKAIVASGDKRFTARVTVVTSGSNQTVTITPQGLEVTEVSVKLKRTS
jgi:hypothetical protein